jgi:hypothetical protein
MLFRFSAGVPGKLAFEPGPGGRDSAKLEIYRFTIYAYCGNS